MNSLGQLIKDARLEAVQEVVGRAKIVIEVLRETKPFRRNPYHIAHLTSEF